MINNTIVRNRSTGSGVNAQGAGIHAYWGSAVSGKNNIVYNNVATSSANVYGPVSFTYSCVGGGLAGVGNIAADPWFVHQAPRAYFLLSQTAAGQVQDSPCVDAGDPNSPLINGTTRTDGVPDAGIVDIGYHWDLPESLLEHLGTMLSMKMLEEEVQNSELYDPEHEFALKNHPNPFNPTTVISYKLHDASYVNLAVYDIAGRKIAELVNGWRDTGVHEVIFDGSHLASGLYFYRLKAGDFTALGKMVLVK